MLYPLSYGGDGGSVLGTRWGLRRRRAGNPPAMSASDKAWIKVDKFTGIAKEKVGRVTGNRRMQFEGRSEQMNASVRSAGEKIKDSVRGRRTRTTRNTY
ncbi:hypothetical protein MMUR_59820 [Mycolicibacterium murale]|uniref:CsbD-like domain-containing protein n=2 Tax=Mycolicibacterium murale TaxID=182220 RepID=A0A7I9WXC7_9MYCO|nr:hypothetical protein MMUR_59820 [Mycolicibacterium murale]